MLGIVGRTRKPAARDLPGESRKFPSPPILPKNLSALILFTILAHCAKLLALGQAGSNRESEQQCRSFMRCLISSSSYSAVGCRCSSSSWHCASSSRCISDRPSVPVSKMGDRLFWSWLSRHGSQWREVLVLVQPETVLAWQRKRFHEHWARLGRHHGAGRPIGAPQSPWQNPYVERLNSSNRWDCLDQVVVLSDRHLKRVPTQLLRLLPSLAHASLPYHGLSGIATDAATLPGSRGAIS